MKKKPVSRYWMLLLAFTCVDLIITALLFTGDSHLLKQVREEAKKNIWDLENI